MAVYGFCENKCKHEVYNREEVDSKTQVLQTQINSLASGSPLVATTIEEMTNTSKVYVNTTDGNWYYYNGTNWVIGGAYQSTGIAENSISYKNLNDSLKELFIEEKEKVISFTEEDEVGEGNSFRGWANKLIDLNRINHKIEGVKIKTVSDTESYELTFQIRTNNDTESIIYEDKQLVNNGTQVQEVFFYPNIDLTGYENVLLCIIAPPNVGIAPGKTNSCVCTPAIEENTYYLNKTSSSEASQIIFKTLTSNIYYINLEIFNPKIKVNSEIKIEKVIDSKKQLVCFNNIKKWNDPVDFVHNGDNISFKPKTSGVSGIQTTKFKPEQDKLVHIKYKITNPNNTRMVLSLGGNETYISVQALELSEGEHEITFDPAYYQVYENLEEYTMVITAYPSIEQQTILIEKLEVYQSNIVDISIYNEKLEEIIKNIDNKLNSQSINETQESNFIVAPNGDRYISQIKNDGTMINVPVIPSKTLFIGNSLLLGNHKETYSNYDECFGMCASNSSSDYYYHIKQTILNKNENATFVKTSGINFEGATNTATVNNYLQSLSDLLTSDLKLVIIQLGDNVNTEEKVNIFKDSCLTLIKHIRNVLPEARVVWVGAWYSNDEKQEIMKKACYQSGTTFINIRDLRNTQNEGYVGQVITYDDGTTSTVESSGVASHPGDLGMKAIANRILYKLGITDTENEIQ